MANRMFIASVSSAALAGLLFGFDTAVIAGVTTDVREAFSLSQEALGVTVSAALWGTLIGAVGAGRVGDALGSRNGMRLTALLFILSAIGCAFAPHWYALILFRVIGGLGIGASSVLAPVYLAEIASTRRRGLLVGLFQLNIVTGILLAYLSNFMVARLELGDAEWRWKFGVMVLPAALLLLLLLVVPSSPRWLAMKGRHGEAGDALRKLGIAQTETAGELLDVPAAPNAPGARLSWSKHRRPILLAVSIAFFNQLSGINAILYYLNDIFRAAGFDKLSSESQAVAIGATNLLFTGVAMLCIDRFGRRKLLLIGAGGTAACLTLVALVMSGAVDPRWLLWALIGFIGSFAFSQGAVIWVYLSEVFPTSVRARGQALGSATHWLLNASLALSFPTIAALSPSLPFAFFAGMMLLQGFVVWQWYPETGRRSLEDIQGDALPGRNR